MALCIFFHPEYTNSICISYPNIDFVPVLCSTSSDITNRVSKLAQSSPCPHHRREQISVSVHLPSTLRLFFSFHSILDRRLNFQTWTVIEVLSNLKISASIHPHPAPWSIHKYRVTVLAVSSSLSWLRSISIHSISNATMPKPIFQNFTIAVTGDFGANRSPEQMRSWIQNQGGTFAYEISPKVTHLICSKDHFKKSLKPGMIIRLACLPNRWLLELYPSLVSQRRP